MTGVRRFLTMRSSVAALLLGSFVLAAPVRSAPEETTPVSTSPAPSVPTVGGPGLDGLRDEFPGVLQAMQDTAAPSLQAVTADGRAGRIGRGELVWASEPLTAGGAPVQRALQVDAVGVARPANPLVAAELPLDATAPFEVGSGPASFSVVPSSVADGRHTVLGDGVLHADTHPATDSLVRAVTGGVESYELLAAADAPELFRYRIQGATPRPGRDPGLVEIVKGAEVVGTVTAPVVVDASGRRVAASLTVDGSYVDFAVRHRLPDTAYPVLADPLWTTDYSFGNPDEGVEGLFYSHEPAGGPSHYWTAATNASDGSSPWRGITIRPAGGRTYVPGDAGRASFVAPPGARITKADFRGVYRRNDSDRQTIRLALYGDGPAVVNDFSNTVTFGTTPSIVLNAPPGGATSTQVWMFTPPCENGEANCPRFVDAANASRVSVDQLIVTLDDPGAPTASIGGSVAALGPEWRKAEGKYDIHVSASDNGSGIASWRIVQLQGSAIRDELANTVVPCDPRHNTANQGSFVCPSVTGSNGTEIDLELLREGRIRIQAEATDFAGNTQDGSGNPLELRLDRTAPTLDPIGGSLLAGAPNRWQQLRGSKALTVKARDTYSGVKSADVSVAWSDDSDDRTVDLCQPAGGLDQPCPTQYEGTVPVDADLLPDGLLTVTAKARDHVGYESAEQSRTLYKDNTNPAATARGELTDLEGEWTNSTERTSVKLQGKDRRSGVARLELYATDANGRRLIDDIAVCDPAAVDASQPDGHCPREIARDASVDLGDFDTGEVTLEAYATDAAGNRDPSPDSWDTYLDYDPPSAVSRINSIALNAETTRVSWTPASDEGSGIAGYEYRLETADGSFTDWNPTPYPGAQIPTSFEDGWIEIRAKDKTGNRGPVASDEVMGYRTAAVARADPKWLDAPGYFRVSSWCRASDPRWSIRSGSYSTARKSYTEKRIGVRADTTVACRKESGGGYEVKNIVVSTQVRPTDTSDLVDPGFSESDKRGPFKAPRSVAVGVSHDCTPGKRTYELRVHFRAEVENFRKGLLHKDWIVNDVTVAAPKTFYMECNRAGIWRVRVYNSSVDAKGKRQRPSVFLRSALDASSWHVDSIKGDRAHHLIPTYLRASHWQAIQARGYSCRIRPNEAVNGAFLPTWLHNRQHGRPAAERLERTLDSALIKRSGTWNGGCSNSTAEHSLKGLAIALEKQGRQ